MCGETKNKKKIRMACGVLVVVVMVGSFVSDVHSALNGNGWRWRWGGWCQGAMYLCERRAGSYSRRMHGACTRIRRCSHVDHIFRTDVVVAIDLFDYVTRAKHSRTHTHSHTFATNETNFNAIRSNLWLSPVSVGSASSLALSSDKILPLSGWTHRNRCKYQQSTAKPQIYWKLGWLGVSSEHCRVHTTANIVEYFDIYYALLCWLIDVNPEDEQIAPVLRSVATVTPVTPFLACTHLSASKIGNPMDRVFLFASFMA